MTKEVAEIISNVKQKREFSGLPDSLIYTVLETRGIKNKTEVEKIKLTRAFLRKYFGVFMTNKVLRGVDEKVLLNHISSKKRDYDILYKKIREFVGCEFSGIVDFGCGMNGFSYQSICDSFGKIKYIGVEATRQLCDSQNKFFKINNFDAEVIWGDLLNFDLIDKILLRLKAPNLFFVFQVVDALENVRPNSSKEFFVYLNKHMDKKDFLIVSNSLKSISGKNNFKIRRKWLEEFFLNDFVFVSKFDLFNEEFLILKKK